MWRGNWGEGRGRVTWGPSRRLSTQDLLHLSSPPLAVLSPRPLGPAQRPHPLPPDPHYSHTCHTLSLMVSLWLSSRSCRSSLTCSSSFPLAPCPDGKV